MIDEDWTFQPLSRSIIRQNLAEVREMLREGHSLPALIMGWSTMEAAGRALLPSSFLKPQKPGRVIEVLAAHDLLSAAEADQLRALARLRNRAIHGAFLVSVSKSAMENLLALVSRMLSEIPADDPAHGRSDI